MNLPRDSSRSGSAAAIGSRSCRARGLKWAICDWSLVAIGAISVPIYPTSSTLKFAYILGDSGASLVVCENAEQQAKVEPAFRDLASLSRLILLEGEPGQDALSLDALRERGRALLAADPGVVNRARGEIGEGDELTIVYTSGTTGPPKGCLLTHRNYVAAVDAVLAVEGLLNPGDRALLHLPLAHSFARLVEFLGPSAHLTIAFCPEPAQIPDALREVQPTLLPSVPRLYERFAAAIRSGIDEQHGLQGLLARRALKVGRRTSADRERGRRLPPLLALELGVDKLVLARVRQRLGGHLRIAISGGAPLPKETAQLLDALGVRVLEGYGLTECTSIATVNQPRRYRLGTVGLPLKGVELRIADDGEILIRSATVFAGYYRDEQATHEILTQEGWLRSGDLGELDPDGFLTITGRKKDIIITGGGDNISPQNIELVLEGLPLHRPGARRRRSAPLPRRAARPRRRRTQQDRRRPRPGTRTRQGRRRQNQPHPRPRRTDTSLRRHSTPLRRGRRTHPHTQVPPPSLRRPLRRRNRAALQPPTFSQAPITSHRIALAEVLVDRQRAQGQPAQPDCSAPHATGRAQAASNALPSKEAPIRNTPTRPLPPSWKMGWFGLRT